MKCSCWPLALAVVQLASLCYVVIYLWFIASWVASIGLPGNQNIFKCCVLHDDEDCMALQSIFGLIFVIRIFFSEYFNHIRNIEKCPKPTKDIELNTQNAVGQTFAWLRNFFGQIATRISPAQTGLSPLCPPTKFRLITWILSTSAHKRAFEHDHILPNRLSLSLSLALQVRWLFIFGRSHFIPTNAILYIHRSAAAKM